MILKDGEHTLIADGFALQPDGSWRHFITGQAPPT
jgi:hypothetical protein